MTTNLLYARKKFILVILLAGLFNRSFAQQLSIGKYIIFTFENKYKISPHGTKTFYWIVAEDSVKSYNLVLHHLFSRKYYSNTYLTDCCAGKDIDPFLDDGSPTATYDPLYYKSLDTLNKIVKKNRRKLQTNIKKWKDGQQEYTTIFATPVSGKFCSSNFHILGQMRLGYKRKVYMPYSSFSYSKDFWKSEFEKAKYILHYDYYSKVKFDIIPN